jgi:quercetin dioxygenase-like cupin family protein
MLKNSVHGVKLAQLAFAGALLTAALPAYSAEDTIIKPLMSKELADLQGKEGLMLTVEYAPGASSPKHRHDAHVFVYVLQGSIQMQAESGKLVTLKPGETFYENPADVHAVSRNASKTKPAKFVVFMVKNKGAPPVLPAN